MADADSFFREEILGIFLGMLDESELDHLYHILYFHLFHQVTVIFQVFLAEYFKSLCCPHRS